MVWYRIQILGELECLHPTKVNQIVPNDCHVIFDTLLFIAQDEGTPARFSLL